MHIKKNVMDETFSTWGRVQKCNKILARKSLSKSPLVGQGARQGIISRSLTEIHVYVKYRYVG
jgi:hypothetical protein